jgi:hypothetical protein
LVTRFNKLSGATWRWLSGESPTLEQYSMILHSLPVNMIGEVFTFYFSGSPEVQEPPAAGRCENCRKTVRVFVADLKAWVTGVS